jgi:hypothetical protein
MPGYFDKIDAGKERLRKDIARLERDLERIAPRNVQQRFLKDYYAKSDKLNALYREIDNIGVAPVEKSSAVVDMFDYANQLRTATLNNDPKTIMAIIKQLKKEGKVPGAEVLERAGKKASERAQRGMAERDKLVETLGKRLGLPGRVSERTVTEEEYDQIAARITELMDSIDTPKGRAKDHGNPGFLQKCAGKGLVIGDLGAACRCLADAACNVGIDIERTFRLGAGDAFRCVQHVDHQIAAALEKLAVGRKEVLRAGQRLERRILRHR